MLLPLLAALLLAGQDPEPPPARKDLGLEFDVLGWYVSTGGWVNITKGSRPGTATPVHLGSDAELDSELAPELEARWEFLESHALGVRGTVLDLSGTGVTDEGFIYHDVVFDAGRTVRAEMDMTLIQFDYQYTALRTEEFRLGLHLGAEYWGFSMRVSTRDALPPLDTQRAFNSAFWLAGIDLDWRPTPEVSLKYFIVGGTERHDQNFYDMTARAVWNPWKGLGLELGYRYQSMHFRQSTNRSDFRFQGPEFGVEIRF